jgi:hypothetical protein
MLVVMSVQCNVDENKTLVFIACAMSIVHGTSCPS